MEIEGRYRRLIEAVTDYIFTVRVENERAVETIHGKNSLAITGYSAEEFAANPMLWIEMVPQADRPAVEQQVARVLSGQNSPPIEHRIRKKDGTVRWVLNISVPQFSADGKLVAYDGLLRDITKQKRAEDALRRLNAELEQRVADRTAEVQKRVQEVTMLATAVRHLGEGVLITEDILDWPGPTIVFVNEAMCRITGYRADELIGQTPRRMQGPRTDRQTLDRMKWELSAGRAFQCELVNYRRDGTAYDAELFVTPLFAPDGRRTHYVSIHRDVSERRQTERELRQSEERFRLFMDNSPTIAWMKDHQGRYVYLSKTLEKHFNICFEDWRGKTDFDVWPFETAQAFRKNDLHVERTGQVLEVIEKTPNPDDTCQDWWVFKFPFEDASGTRYVGGIGVDITERNRIEQALRQSENHIRAILNAAADAIITVDRHGSIIGINPATERLFGYAENELLGQNVRMLMPPPYHDDHDSFIARYLQTRKPKIIGSSREVVARRKDGTTFPVDLAVNAVDHLDLFTGIVRDLTERKRLEQEILEIAIEEQRRIGQDLHDSVGQELTGIGLMAGTLEKSLSGHFLPAADLAHKIVERLKWTITDVRKFARGLNPVDVDSRGLMSALNGLAERINEIHGVFCTFECKAPVLFNDNQKATHLYRIAQESTNNAIKHGKAKNIVISLHQQSGVATLSIRDDGIGFEPRGDLEHGLGLRIMGYRAHAISGRLAVENTQPGGTMVTCTVPV